MFVEWLSHVCYIELMIDVQIKWETSKRKAQRVTLCEVLSVKF